MRAAIFETDEHEAAAAEIPGDGKGHRQRVCDRNCGIDRSSAVAQHAGTRLRR